MFASIGIDNLHVYGSTLAVDAAAICAARGTPVDEARRLGLVRRSLAPGYEDPVTLAVNAARPLVDAYGKDAFELVLVATESGVDYAKPLGSYLHRHLELSERCFHVEMKHACFGATAALHFAAAWVRVHPEKRALVVATDMARSILGEPAEAAGGGAGAVAMAITASPRVLELEPYRGFASREIYDVNRPNAFLERSDGNLSIAGYLDLLEIAWDGYRRLAGPRALERLDYLAFHTPVTPLVRAAHRLLCDVNDIDGAAEVAARFDRQVAPSLRYCGQLGNLYSGCLYVALAGLLDTAPEPLAGRTVGLYSYGSGSGAGYFSGKVGAEASAIARAHRLSERLAARRIVDVPTYERIVNENERCLTEADFVPDRAIVPDHYEAAYRGQRRLVLEGVHDHYRSYAWS